VLGIARTARELITIERRKTRLQEPSLKEEKEILVRIFEKWLNNRKVEG